MRADLGQRKPMTLPSDIMEWFLSWSGSIGLAVALAAPFTVWRYGRAGAIISMLLVALLSAASFWYFWTVDLHDEVIEGNSEALGLMTAFALLLFGSLTIGGTLVARRRARRPENV